MYNLTLTPEKRPAVSPTQETRQFTNYCGFAVRLQNYEPSPVQRCQNIVSVLQRFQGKIVRTNSTYLTFLLEIVLYHCVQYCIMLELVFVLNYHLC